MSSLRGSFESLAALGSKLEELLASSQHPGMASFGRKSDVPGLREIDGFGDNPGELRMLLHVPEIARPAPGLVVALHGCGQTAAEYAHGTGWSALAERHGFLVLYPEQRSSNNPRACFSWFNPGDTRRGRGEVHSVQQMVERTIAEHGVDARKVYVTGLSAGGAMASALLATYPDTYAGGSVIGGLPYGAASTVQEALEAMFSDDARDRPEVLADRVRMASRHTGPWPMVSVWHGTADPIVKSANGDQVARQWAAVHGSYAPPEVVERGGHTRRTWLDASGRPCVEAHTIQGMSHGVPLYPEAGPEPCGAAGPFFLDVGLCSTRNAAAAWGLIDSEWVPSARSANQPPNAAPGSAFTGANRFGSPSQDPAEIIEKALAAAGLSAESFKGALGKGDFSPHKVIADALRIAGLKK